MTRLCGATLGHVCDRSRPALFYRSWIGLNILHGRVKTVPTFLSLCHENVIVRRISMAHRIKNAKNQEIFLPSDSLGTHFAHPFMRRCVTT